jgi:hypothetical protein
VTGPASSAMRSATAGALADAAASPTVKTKPPPIG